MQNAALYIRVSTDDQTEYSPAAQKNALMQYAVKNEYHVSEEHIFADEGFSGRTAEKRPAFMKMIGMAKAKEKPFDVILVHKFDRFARNRETSVTYKRMLQKDYEIKVISITESIEDDKLSLILEAMLEAMAEYYSINLAEEVKKGMTEKAKQGGFQTSPPFGYAMNESGHLTIVEEEAQYIRYIFDQYVNHNQGCFPIARNLNMMGAKTKRGGKMDNRGVSYILQNPVYIGKVRWTPTTRVRRNFDHPETIIADSKHEPIISDELFNSAGDKIKESKKKSKPKARPLSECKHWLSGLVKCSNCGSTLILASNLKYPSFQCHGYSKGMCRISHSITVKKIESAILDKLSVLMENLDSIEYMVHITRKDDIRLHIDNMEKEKKGLENKHQRANNAYLAGIYTLEEYQITKRQLDKEMEKMYEELAKLKKTTENTVSNNFKGTFHSVAELLLSDSDIITKQNAARSIIEKIIYDKPNENLELYLYDC